ncbi:hypothetical protein PR002_g29682 [Phytophthora rubi]|uniref:Uncharacterized protein n=1 Tax=Phytophthora rubi TaxID=129364 RepID=A0A6A3GZ04_9STRA|nr:hypothetical protein PR002_g29682 [Phytophthora rubi]
MLVLLLAPRAATTASLSSSPADVFLVTLVHSVTLVLMWRCG